MAQQNQLSDLLLLGHRHIENPELTPLQRAAITRQLYSCVLERPEWRECFLPSSEDPSSSSSSSSTATSVPSWDNLYEWLVPSQGPASGDGFGPEKTWSLYDAQQAIEEKARKAGKSTKRPKPGAVCGKVLQRYDRTYICK